MTQKWENQTRRNNHFNQIMLDISIMTMVVKLVDLWLVNWAIIFGQPKKNNRTIWLKNEWLKYKNNTYANNYFPN
jgi:hypothetical protein